MHLIFSSAFVQVCGLVVSVRGIGFGKTSMAFLWCVMWMSVGDGEVSLALSNADSLIMRLWKGDRRSEQTGMSCT